VELEEEEVNDSLLEDSEEELLKLESLVLLELV
jgi:hypothetical protein